MEKAREEIDSSYPLHEFKHYISFREDDRYGQLTNSVVAPGHKQRLPGERDFDVGRLIYRNCDQIRAMIKKFTINNPLWDLDSFRLALRHDNKNVSRPQMKTFLEKKGSLEGEKSTVYQLAWEFFERRKLLRLEELRSYPDDARKFESHREDLESLEEESDGHTETSNEGDELTDDAGGTIPLREAKENRRAKRKANDVDSSEDDSHMTVFDEDDYHSLGGGVHRRKRRGWVAFDSDNEL